MDGARLEKEREEPDGTERRYEGREDREEKEETIWEQAREGSGGKCSCVGCRTTAGTKLRALVGRWL